MSGAVRGDLWADFQFSWPHRAEENRKAFLVKLGKIISIQLDVRFVLYIPKIFQRAANKSV